MNDPGNAPQDQSRSPTVEPRMGGMNSALLRNIEALRQRQEAEDASAGFQEKLAAGVTAFTGSMVFVYVHLAIVAAWIAVNVGAVPGVQPFDRTFVILATAASVEAIFLSTFVLISQNRAARTADRRASLDLQINLLTEHEVTRLITLTTAIADKLGVHDAQEPDLAELQRNVAPEVVLDTLEQQAKD